MMSELELTWHTMSTVVTPCRISASAFYTTCRPFVPDSLIRCRFQELPLCDNEMGWYVVGKRRGAEAGGCNGRDDNHQSARVHHQQAGELDIDTAVLCVSFESTGNGLIATAHLTYAKCILTFT
jgi:hypothetical protein